MFMALAFPLAALASNSSARNSKMPSSLQSQLQLLWSAVPALDLLVVLSTMIFCHHDFGNQARRKGSKSPTSLTKLGQMRIGLIGGIRRLAKTIKQTTFFLMCGSFHTCWTQMDSCLDASIYLAGTREQHGHGGLAFNLHKLFDVGGQNANKFEHAVSLGHTVLKINTVFCTLCDDCGFATGKKRFSGSSQHLIDKYGYSMDRPSHPSKCHTIPSSPAAQ